MNGSNILFWSGDRKSPAKSGFKPVDRTGSHLKLRYEHPETGEVRIVTVPMKSEDKIPTGTLKSIANQAGAEDFHAWCQWIDENR